MNNTEAAIMILRALIEDLESGAVVGVSPCVTEDWGPITAGMLLHPERGVCHWTVTITGSGRLDHLDAKLHWQSKDRP